MVRRKQTNPYHGTKESVDSISNTEPLIATVIALPKRPFPPLLRFGVLVSRSENPDVAKLKLIDDFDYRHEQGDDIQRSIQEMSLGDLRNVLNELGLTVKGKKQKLINRLIGAQAKGVRTGKGGKEKSTRPRSRPTSPGRPGTPPKSPKESDENGVKHEEKNGTDSLLKAEVEEKQEGDDEEEVDDEDKDEISTSSSPYANLKVTELRTELRRRGLSCLGRKDELADRLEADDSKNTPPSHQEVEVEGNKKSRGLKEKDEVKGGRKQPGSDEEDSGQEDDDDDTDEYLGEEDGRRPKRKIEPKKEKKGTGHWRKKKRV